MKIRNRFEIAAPLARVWPILCDVPLVASCLPNATVEAFVDARTYRVKAPVRFGIVTIVYRATVTVLERDDDAHRAVLDIVAKQLLGAGNVCARVAVAAQALGERTGVDLVTDAELGGFVATVGGAIVDRVARRTVEQFAQKLETIIV